MNRIVILFAIILLSLLNSCIGRTWFKPKDFTYLYNKQDTGLDTIINISGYYLSEEGDSFMFYRNGLVCFSGDDPTIYYKKGCPHLTWGTYIFNGKDTIQAQGIEDTGAMTNLDVRQEKYFITSKYEVILVSINGYLLNKKYKFHPLKNRMDSSGCWLLKKKWFWDKEAWENRSK